MKSTINKPKPPMIDWSKPQLVQFKNEDDTIVLTNGEHNSGYFNGTCLSTYRQYQFKTDWIISPSWKIFTGNITLSNK